MDGFQLSDVFGADFCCSEEAQKRGARRRSFECRASIGFLALDDADYSGDHHAGFARRFDGGDGGGAGSADVVDDDDASAFSAEAFDAAAGTVGFLSLPHEKSVQERCTGVLLCTPGAGGSDVGNDGICAHGESADGFSLDAVLVEQVEDRFAGEASAFGVKRGGSAIDVVIAGAARGELELAELETGAGEESQELV